MHRKFFRSAALITARLRRPEVHYAGIVKAFDTVTTQDTRSRDEMNGAKGL